MEAIEFKYRFSVLFNNIMSDAAPGMTDYEISYYLTKGQLELVKSYINPKGNKYIEGVDGSPKRQTDLGTLICTKTLLPANSDVVQIDNRSTVYAFPTTPYLAILNETLTIGTKVRQVIPLSYIEYTRLMSKPYKEPLHGQAWRLQTNGGNAEIIVPSYDRNENAVYTIKYIKYPRPIIVGSLDGLRIEGVSDIQTSELNEELHEEIVQRAVELAKATYASDQSGQAQMQNQITVGQRSE